MDKPLTRSRSRRLRRSPSPSSSPDPSIDRDVVCCAIRIQAAWRGFRERWVPRRAAAQPDTDASSGSKPRVRQSTAMAIVSWAGEFLAKTTGILCLCAVAFRAVGWFTGETFGITCPAHESFASWDTGARNSVAQHLHEAETYLTHIYRLETEIDYRTSCALHTLHHSTAGARGTKSWSEVSLLEHGETEVARAADRLADTVSKLRGFGVLDRCAEQGVDTVSAKLSAPREGYDIASTEWCAERQHEFNCRAIDQDDTHDWVMRHADSSGFNAEADDATICYQRAKNRLKRLRFKTRCAEGWLGNVFGLKHGWCGASGSWGASWGGEELLEGLQRILFDVEPFECVTVDEWFHIKTWALLVALWNFATMLSSMFTLVEQRNIKDELEEVFPSTTDNLFAGMLRISYNLLVDKEDGRTVFAMRTLDKQTLADFFCGYSTEYAP